MDNKLFKKADALKKQISDYGKLPDDVLKKVNYKFRLEWNFHSNSMEGNTLTLDETRSVMVGNVTVSGKSVKDILDIKGHDEVVRDILKMGAGELNISESRIKNIHKNIIYEDNPDLINKIGKWKTSDNKVINYRREEYYFKSHHETPELMHQLINWLNVETDKIKKNAANKLHPVELAFELHLRFIDIHPFFDGNGRIVRILTNLILISFGYPPMYIKVNEKDSYGRLLADVLTYGSTHDFFYDFMTEKLIRSLNIIIDAINGKDINELEDWEKELQLIKATTAGKETLKAAKNDETVKEVLRKSIIPTFKLVFEKLKGFTDLFVKYSWHIGNQYQSTLITGATEIESSVMSFANESTTDIAILLKLEGNKNESRLDESFTVLIQFDFKKFYYEYAPQMTHGPEESLPSKKYDEFLTDDEMKLIVNSQAKRLLEQIKQSEK